MSHFFKFIISILIQVISTFLNFLLIRSNTSFFFYAVSFQVESHNEACLPNPETWLVQLEIHSQTCENMH